MNIAHFVSGTARVCPDREALQYEGTSYSYADVDVLSARVAAGLRSSGIKRGGRVAIFLPNRAEFIFAYLGAARLGALVVSLSPQMKRDEVRYILSDSSASVIFTDSERRHQVPDDVPTLKEVILCDSGDAEGCRLSAWLSEPGPLLEPTQAEPGDDLALLYTSGTTGFPKGVTLTHGNVGFAVEALARYCKTASEDRLLLMVPLSHCYGQNLVLNHALKASATIVLLGGFDPQQLLALIERERITMLFGVPAMYSSLLDACTNPEQLQSVRYCMSGAISLPEKIALAWFERFGLCIHQGYGLTESSPLASYNHFPQTWPNSIGRPVDGVEMRLIDEDGLDPGAGKPGEILIRGPNVMKGYWNKPQETSTTIQNGWLHTGDLGRCDAEGNFYVIDRLKDMINVSGLKAYPAEVELVLNQYHGVREAAVFGIPHPVVGERVGAMLVLHEGCEATVQEIVAFCRESLASYKVPEQIQFVASLPRNASGKLLRRVLRTGMHLSPQRNLAAHSHHFEGILSSVHPWFVDQRQVFGVPMLSPTVMIEWAIATVQSITASTVVSRVLEGLEFTRPMVFTADQSRVVQAVVERDRSVDDTAYRIRFLSRNMDEPHAEWQEHGSMVSRPSDVSTSVIQVVPARLKQQLEEKLLDLYEQLRLAGQSYGLAFQGLKQLWRKGNQALGRIDVPQSSHDGNAYVLHPVVLDACFHTIMAFFDSVETHTNTTLIPVAIKKLTVHARLPSCVWCYATWHGEQGDGRYLADLELMSEAGESFVSIQGVYLGQVDRPSILAATAPSAMPINAPVPMISASELASLSGQEAAQLIFHGLRKILGDVLRIDMSREFSDDKQLAEMSLSSLGIDSLRAMELRNAVYAWVSVHVPVQMFISRSRVADAVDCIYEGVLVGSLSQTDVSGDLGAQPVAEFEVVVL